LVFWGWVLGPAGMFLSVPLTMALKIVFGANPQTYPIAILLGPAGEARAVETAEDSERPTLTALAARRGASPERGG
jgi:AI-2 transport protein TqsA